MNRFTGKTILITGGTSGMGLATAHRLVAEGAHVIVTGRTRARVDSAADRLGPHASGFVADTADVDAVDALMETVRDRHGRLDCLFVNAGTGEQILAGLEQWLRNTMTEFAGRIRELPMEQIPEIDLFLFSTEGNVSETGKELIITERGEPVLKIVPISASDEDPLASLKGLVERYDQPLEPVGVLWKAAESDE